MALQEMQALLPSPLIAATDAKSPDSSAAQSSNSKAAKVESAIDYIRQLKQEVSERDRLIESKDQEMEQLRKELAALRRSSSVGSAAEIAAQLKSEPVSTPSTDSGT
jgi:vacuolar-type H+-ATPase subunit I/STV1